MSDYVRINNTTYSTGQYDGLGTPSVRPDFFGKGAGLKQKIPWPHQGYIESWPITVNNTEVVSGFRYAFSAAGDSANAIVSQTSSVILIWYSNTPGGDPLIQIDGTKLVYNFQSTEFYHVIGQRYSVNDPNTNPSSLCVPIINKTYYINFAGVSTATAQQCSTKWGNTINPTPRAPTSSELVNFPASDIGGRSTLALIVSTDVYGVLPYEDYVKEVT